tara:strand:- start:1229 stop:1456 length:228 start_codon:yes stop_codon:yes gene_type:complete
MRDYKITNLKTNVVHFMNEKQKERFLKVNHKNNSYYIAKELKENKRNENLQILLFCFFAVAVSLTSFCLYLQLNY